MGLRPFTKLTKRLVISIATVFVVLVLAFVGLMELGINYCDAILHDLVENETDGYYELTFDKIDISLWNKTIKIGKVKLEPDLSKSFSEETVKKLYNLELAGLHIDLESISSIYIDRQLAIQNVRIIDPRLHIIRKQGTPEESFSLQTGNLYKQISDYLRVLRVDFLAIENGGFKQSPSEMGIGHVDFSIENFLVDSASGSGQKFYSENIELEVNNQSFMLSDSIHELRFDRLLLSTRDSVLTFTNLVLKPITVELGHFDLKDDKIIYDITVPELQLRGVDYFSAYKNNYLEIEELSLTGSHIFLKEQTYAKTYKRVKKDNSLFKQLIKVFDEVKVGKMRLIDTNLDLSTNDDRNHNYQHILSERVDIVLYDVFLDSSNYQFDHRARYFDDVDISVKDYTSYLPDSIHKVNFDLLQLNSFDSTLVFKNFKIANNGKGSASDMFLSMDLPLLSLKGMNYLDILIHQKLRIGEVLLVDPHITFEKGLHASKQKPLSPDQIYAIIQDQFSVIGINKLQLRQGTFSINKKINVGQIDLLVTDFNINETCESWYDVVTGLEANLHNLSLHDDQIDLRVKDLKLNRLASQLSFNGLAIDYLDEYKSVSGDFTQLTLSGLNLDSLSAGQYLAFDSLNLIEPQVTLELLKPIETDQERKDNLKHDVLGNRHITVVDGELHGNLYDSTTFDANHININLTFGVLNDLQYTHAEQIHFTSPTLSNQIDINDLTFSDSQDLSVNGIEIQSMQDTVFHQVELDGNIPNLTLYGLDQAMYWEHHSISGDSLIIETPDLTLNLNDLLSDIATDSQASEDTLEIAFQKIILQKARLAFSDQSQAAIESVKTPELSLTLDGFQYPHKSLVSADHLIYADDVTLNLKDLRPIMTNGDSMAISALNFNKQDELILIDTLYFDQAAGATSALLHGVKIVGLDLDAYRQEHHLKLDSVVLTAPHISISPPDSSGNKPPPKPDFPKSFDIKYFSSVATEIQFSDSLQQNEYALHEGILEVHEFYAEEQIDWNLFLNHSQYTSIRGSNFSLPLDDGYQISIDGYALQHPQNTVTLDHIKLTSKFTPEEYSSQLTIQKGWYDVQLDQLSFSGLDLARSLSQKQYYTDKVSLEGVDVTVYRDKSIPFQSLQNKKLPQSMLRNLNTWVYIDTLQVHGDITYQQKPDEKELVGEISFNDIDASLFQITSVDSLALNPMHFVSTGKLADTANFKIDVKFDLHDPKDKFILAGQVEDMELGALNKMLRPVANINIKGGYAQRIAFDLVADNELAKGAMKIRYHHLKIQILDPEKSALKHPNQGFKSFFANTFVVKSRNPTFLVVKTGVIFQKRDPSRAIFQYWAKSLLSGAVSSIGINKTKKAEKKNSKMVKAKKDKTSRR